MISQREEIFRANIQYLFYLNLVKLDENGIPNFADKEKRSSIIIAQLILERLGFHSKSNLESGLGRSFTFQQIIFNSIEQFLGGNYGNNQPIWLLKNLEDSFLTENLGSLSRLKEYLLKNGTPSKDLDLILFPDILLFKIKDRLSSKANFEKPSLFDINNFILNACISCKWTIQSSDSKTTSFEVFNLIRNRKGHLPHIVAVTAEPLPTRIASLALGTGDLDCVYHFALDELIEATREVDNEGQMDMLQILIDGRRLRDISDLPFDLIV